MPSRLEQCCNIGKVTDCARRSPVHDAFPAPLVAGELPFSKMLREGGKG
jgi:hypothetical protein